MLIDSNDVEMLITRYETQLQNRKRQTRVTRFEQGVMSHKLEAAVELRCAFRAFIDACHQVNALPNSGIGPEMGRAPDAS